MNKPLGVLGLCVILGAGAVLGEAKVEGPRLSDTELLACFDPNFPALSKVIALRDSGQTAVALSTLVGSVRTRQEPAVATEGKEGSPPDHTSHFFPYAGQVVLRSDWQRDALFLGFEAGPFGYGHQHEDKLGIGIFADGKDLLVEGGSYAYDASKWRRYVLASAAHNVILIDGQGQVRTGLPRQNYVTDKPLDLAFRSNDRYDYARGVYEDGFGKRGQHPARHTREVLFLKLQRLFVVRDTLESLDGKPHLYEALWHLDVNAVDVDGETGMAEMHDPGANLRIVPFCDQGLKARVVKGQETPTVQGWMPLGHGIRGVRPIPTVVLRMSRCRARGARDGVSTAS